MTEDHFNELPPAGHSAVSPGRHQSSHGNLLSRVPRYIPGPLQSRLGLSAIVVPTERPTGMGSGLALAGQIAEGKNVPLIVIRSGRASDRSYSPDMVPRTSVPTVIVDLPAGAESILPFASNDLLVATLHRRSDLGFKRNLGILLGRMCGWAVLLFLDDDIRGTPASQPSPGVPSQRRHSTPLSRLDDVLADFATYPDLHAAGYFQRDMDDNSVVCHARRLVGKPQDIFISGGANAVRVHGPLPMFSRAYNEDWLFFARLMLEGRHMLPSSSVRYIGTIHQDSYYPFMVPRARSEELGDLLAEGLFALIGEARGDFLATATSLHYWEQAVDARPVMISELLSILLQHGHGARIGVFADAERALQAARSIYTDPRIDAAAAVTEFFQTFLDDQAEWARLLAAMTPEKPDGALGLRDALDVLGLARHTTWVGGDGDFLRQAS